MTPNTQVSGMRITIWVVLAVLTIIPAVTYIALELDGVLVARTVTPGTSIQRETHIWFVSSDNQMFLEAGNPDNPWVQDLQNGSPLYLENQSIGGQYSYVLNNTASNVDIRRMMREKYGWRDVWIGLLFDTSQSFSIQVDALDQ